jgi:hypothetical protein
MKNWNWILIVLVTMSIFTVTKKGNFKCRIYEDNYETSVPDIITNINRKSRYTNIINFYQDEE